MPQFYTTICAVCKRVIRLGTSGREIFSTCPHCAVDTVERIREARALLTPYRRARWNND